MTSKLEKSLSKYPRFRGLCRTLKGPSSNPCRVCSLPAWRYAEVEVSWFRGEDVSIALCKSDDCLAKLRKSPGEYA